MYNLFLYFIYTLFSEPIISSIKKLEENIMYNEIMYKAMEKARKEKMSRLTEKEKNFFERIIPELSEEGTSLFFPDIIALIFV